MAADVGGGDGKAKPRIDMTPMVDLGFLLLTFFVLTTTMNTPTAMPIVVPPKQKEIDKTPPPKVAESKVVMVLVGDKNRVYFYQGVEDKGAIELNSAEFKPGDIGVRTTLLDYREKIRTRWANDKDNDPMIVIIKFADKSRFRNFVDILDEMNIIKQRKYIVDKITPRELEMIADYEKNQAGGA